MRLAVLLFVLVVVGCAPAKVTDRNVGLIDLVEILPTPAGSPDRVRIHVGGFSAVVATDQTPQVGEQVVVEEWLGAPDLVCIEHQPKCYPMEEKWRSL